MVTFWNNAAQGANLQLARKSTHLPKCVLILKGPIWIFGGAPTAFHTALGVMNRVSAAMPEHNIFCYSAVAHISTPSVNVAFDPKSGFKNKCRARAGFGLVISGSGRVQASKWGPCTTLCGYVRRGQQEEIERIHPPPTISKNRLKSFCEVGYANFRPNVFGAGKRISMKILVGVGLHAWYPVALKRFVGFSKNANVEEKYLSSL